MTNEEAKVFLDNLKICINEHPIVADWLVEIADRKTEPQRDCGDFADRLAYERGVKHAWEVAQKVFDSTVTFYEAEDVAKQIDKDINVRSKDEPPTCDTCKYADKEWYEEPCNHCGYMGRYEPKTERSE